MLQPQPTTLTGLLDTLQPGQLTVLASKPGFGKSILALTLCRIRALRQNLTTGYICLEMSRDDQDTRLLASEGDILTHRLMAGGMTAEDKERLHAAIARVSAAPLHLASGYMSWPEIQDKIRKLKELRPDLGMVVVDPIEHITYNDHDPAKRSEEVTVIARGLKELAKELDLSIVLLAQLRRRDAAPYAPATLSDLYEGLELQQEADIVLLLHRDEVRNGEDLGTGVAELIVAKRRNGPMTTIPLVCELPYSRFADRTQA